MSAADLDHDGEYELVVKWAPSNSRDNSDVGVTSPTIFDAYDIDYNTGTATRLWRINLGINIRSGAHYNPFLVYDFNSDGYAEFVVKTAPGSIDGKGNYVSESGDTSEIKNTDNSKDYTTQKEIDGISYSRGTIMSGPEYLTVFDGMSGKAIVTTDYWPNRDITTEWGDNYANRSERYLACIAYLDGIHPSIVMQRGYYTNVYLAAFNFDGKSLNKVWHHESRSDGSTISYSDGSENNSIDTAYGDGAHYVVSADVDGDLKDEIIIGASIIDDDGTLLAKTGRGHGDAIHVSDFDNDGNMEIFMVHEHSPYYVDLLRYDKSTKTLVELFSKTYSGDVGRGMAGNFDDTYAVSNPNAASLFISSASNTFFDTLGKEVSNPNLGVSLNGGIYWDNDLSQELLDGTRLAKYSISSGYERFYFGSKDSTFIDCSDNNGTKNNVCLQADLLGDFREEVILRRSDNTGIRIFINASYTNYRIPCLMQDSLYRNYVANQNVGYNQPPHTSYYLGSLSLVSGTNYINPNMGFTKINYVNLTQRIIMSHM